MRISRSPQNGGFHRCTGGGPFREASRATPAMASSPCRACSVSCAMAAICARECRQIKCSISALLAREAYFPLRLRGKRRRARDDGLDLDVEAHFQHPLMGDFEEV